MEIPILGIMDFLALREIKNEFLDDEGWSKKSSLSHDKVVSWMQDASLEVQGAVHRLLYTKEAAYRVMPPLSFQESFEFRKQYYERCLREYTEDISSKEDSWEWADTPFDASHQLVFWFREMWNDDEVPRSVLVGLRDWMAMLLKVSPMGQSLQAAVYDHLCCERKFRKFFAEWEADPEMNRILRLG